MPFLMASRRRLKDTEELIYELSHESHRGRIQRAH